MPYEGRIRCTLNNNLICMTILLVDDDDDDRMLFIESARAVDTNITCVATSNGEEALLYLKNTEHSIPDFIFLDMAVPDLNGRQCLKEIKSDHRLRSAPVIVFTTSRDVRDSVKLKMLGAAHFMSKPVSPDDVYYLLSVVLSQKWD
jgi:CheY-like chemotaxis protein